MRLGVIWFTDIPEGDASMLVDSGANDLLVRDFAVGLSTSERPEIARELFFRSIGLLRVPEVLLSVFRDKGEDVRVAVGDMIGLSFTLGALRTNSSTERM